MPAPTNRRPGDIVRSEDVNDVARVANSAETRVGAVETQVNGRLSEASLTSTIETKVLDAVAEAETGAAFSVFTGRIAAAESAVANPLLAPFRSALAARSVDVLHIGHSITEGTRADAPRERWTDLLRDRIRARAGISGGGFGYVPAAPTYPELLPAAWVFTGNLGTTPNGAGLGGYSKDLLTGGATASLTFTGTGIDVLFTSYSGGPSVPVTIDGAPVASINAASATTNFANRISYRGLTPGEHTVVLSNPTAQFTLQGAMVYDGDETTGVRMWNGGHSGEQVSTLLTGNRATRVPPVYTAIAPDLVTIEFQVNEYRNNVTDTTYGTNLRALIDQVRTAVGASVPIVLIADAEPAHAGTPAAPWAKYGAMTASVAYEKGAVLFDADALPGMGLTGSGTNVDQVHPNEAGHATIGNALANYLLTSTTAEVVVNEGSKRFSRSLFEPVATQARGAVCLSWDDAFASDYTVVHQKLKARGMVGSFFIPSILINGAGRLTAAQIKEMADYGHEIGSHTYDQPDLTTLTAAQRVQHYEHPITALEAIIGKGKVTTFSNPQGRSNADIDSELYLRYQRQVLVNARIPGVVPMSRRTGFSIPRELWRADVIDIVRMAAEQPVIVALYAHDFTAPADQALFDQLLDLIEALGIPTMTFAQAFPAEERLANPGFENGISGWQVLNGNSFAPPTAVADTPPVAFAGTQSARIDTTSDIGFLYLQQSVPVTEGVAYRLSCRTHGAITGAGTGGMYLRIQPVSYTGANIGGPIRSAVRQGTWGWEKNEVMATMPAGTLAAKVSIGIEGNTGSIYVDHVHWGRSADSPGFG